MSEPLARLTAKLDHPHILTLIDSGESDEFLWHVVNWTSTLTSPPGLTGRTAP